MTPLFARTQSTERAFERLYNAHVRDVYRYALMATRNPDDAEDVVQTTFMKAFRAFEAGERPHSPRQWLIKIAHNTCRSRFRDAKRRPKEVALDERLQAADDKAHDGVDPAELFSALGALTFNQRAAIVMRELEGRSYAEIADVLELSSSAVETLIFRARRALREQLEGSLACGEAELALSRDLDGRLDRDERAQLRAHLRACRECAGLARRQRARRAALAGLGPVELPASLASWGGGAAVGAGVAAKVAAIVAAGVAAAGAGYGAADAVGTEVAARDRPAAVGSAVSRAVAERPQPLAAIVAGDGARRDPRDAERTRAVDAAPSARGAARPPAPRSDAAPAATVVARAATTTVEKLAGLVPVPEVPPVPDVPVEVAVELPPVQVPAVPQPPPLPVEPPAVDAPDLPEVPLPPLP